MKGRSQGDRPPLLLDQTEARRPEKKNFGDRAPPPPPTSKGLDDRAPLSQGLDPALFKYLGDVIDQHLSFNNHIKNVANKISKKLGVLRRLRFSFAMAAAELLYKTMIVQIFDYCDVTW